MTPTETFSIGILSARFVAFQCGSRQGGQTFRECHGFIEDTVSRNHPCGQSKLQGHGGR